VAFGLAIGNSVSIFGMTLALGALAVPFVVDVPKDYLLLMVASPALLIPPLLSGSLTPTLSILFIFVYVLIFGYILWRESRMNRTFMESDEVREAIAAADGQGESVPSYVPGPVRRLTEFKWFWPAMLLVGIGGIVVGAEGAATGVEGIQSTWNLTGTFIGVTLVTVLLTLDDLLLIIEPLRLGYYDVAVGGVIGSLLFFVTANVGIIGLVGTINFRWETVFFHLPTLFVFAGLSGYFLWKGEMGRREGALLLGMYILFLAVNIQFFATLPVGE
jgi:cation:H+ antiporter